MYDMGPFIKLPITINFILAPLTSLASGSYHVKWRSAKCCCHVCAREVPCKTKVSCRREGQDNHSATPLLVAMHRFVTFNLFLGVWFCILRPLSDSVTILPWRKYDMSYISDCAGDIMVGGYDTDSDIAVPSIIFIIKCCIIAHDLHKVILLVIV